MKIVLVSIVSLIIGGVIGSQLDFQNEDKSSSVVQDKGVYASSVELFDLLNQQGVVLSESSVLRALRDVRLNKVKLSPSEIAQAKSALILDSQKNGDKIAAKTLVDSRNYLTEQKQTPGMQLTSSGLLYQVIVQGAGQPPAKTDWISVTYKGALKNGSIFDSSQAAGGAVRIPVTNLLPGLQEAVLKMKPGSQWKIIVPPELGYGARVRPGLPANSVLVFDLGLHSVIKR